MEGFKNRKRALSPSSMHDIDHRELDYGTHVPRLESYSQDQLILLRAIDNIKASWACAQHSGTCYITKDSKHIEMNRFRLHAWGAAVVCIFFLLRLLQVVMIFFCRSLKSVSHLPPLPTTFFFRGELNPVALWQNLVGVPDQTRPRAMRLPVSHLRHHLIHLQQPSFLQLCFR